MAQPTRHRMIVELEIEVAVDFLYTPGEPDKLYPPPGEPGYGPEFEIRGIEYNSKQLQLIPKDEDWVQGVLEDLGEQVAQEDITGWKEAAADAAYDRLREPE